MALWEDRLTEAGWGTTGVLGLGSLLFAPVLLPAVGMVVRPVLKGLIWGTLAVTEMLSQLVTETGQQVSALYTEARHEAADTQEAEATAAQPRTVSAAMSSALAGSPPATPENTPASEG